MEFAGEGDLETLADSERTVGLHVDSHIGREEREVIRVRDAGQRKRGKRGERCKPEE